jgi:hypothetical protein
MATQEIVLVEYDKAKRQLARAKSAQEILKIRDVAARLLACAKVANDRQMEDDAWDLRTLAERQLGVEMENRKDERAEAGRPKRVSENPLPTLEANGITKNLANRARRLAELSDGDFGRYRVDGRKQRRHFEQEIVRKSKTKSRKPKPQQEFECPHCGKPVRLEKGKLVRGE